MRFMGMRQCLNLPRGAFGGGGEGLGRQRCVLSSFGRSLGKPLGLLGGTCDSLAGEPVFCRVRRHDLFYWGPIEMLRTLSS